MTNQRELSYNLEKIDKIAEIPKRGLVKGLIKKLKKGYNFIKQTNTPLIKI